ncbi:MAG: prepilin-type N-terminal cleavage/methylation domain-containing protein [Gammaproteobacteria bacterium]|nr:prepilin-type N-terminal cleavage/methylation domain-containing protein [Gammaproteobacteria bacterium]
MRINKHHSGFTLIEVLIAMTLLSVMVVLLFSSMRISAESWQKGEDKITAVNDIAVVYQFFRNHLGTAQPLWDDFSQENDEFSFSGRNQELKFVSYFPASANKTGLQQFEVKLLKEDKEKIIQVSITPFFPIDKHEEWRKEEVTLLRHVKSLSINYYSVDDSETEGIWMEDWIEQDAMPKLVKIQIQTENGDFWPAMVIDLKNEANPNEEDDLSLPDDEQVIDDVDSLNDQQ